MITKEQYEELVNNNDIKDGKAATYDEMIKILDVYKANNKALGHKLEKYLSQVKK